MFQVVLELVVQLALTGLYGNFSINVAQSRVQCMHKRHIKWLTQVEWTIVIGFLGEPRNLSRSNGRQSGLVSVALVDSEARAKNVDRVQLTQHAVT